MTFGRDMTQIRPKNPLKKAISKAALPNLLINTLRMLIIYFFTATCERIFFFLRGEENFFSLTGGPVRKNPGSIYQEFW